jgi:hypothetical protein
MTSWQTFFVNRILTREEITRTVEEILRVSKDNILIIKSLEQLEEQRNTPFTIFIQTFLHPQAPFLFRLEPWGDQVPGYQGEFVHFVGEFCERLHCQALADDHSPSYYSWLLVSSTTQIEPVFVDFDLYDECEPYQVR